MTTIYAAKWVMPISAPAIQDGAVAVEGEKIAGVGTLAELAKTFADSLVNDFGDAAILPGFINCHSHLELSVMRGFLEHEESDFFAWLKKLTIARMMRMTEDDLRASATWGAIEAARAGVTCVADASESASQSMKALSDVGLRGIVFQESFGPDPSLANENFELLRTKIEQLRELENARVNVGVSPHAPYTVSGVQLEMISRYAIEEKLRLMIHAAESEAETDLLRDGTGPFADGLLHRGFDWKAPGVSTIKYLDQCGILDTKPLLAHCIRVDDDDLAILSRKDARIAHCPKSNAKLGHGRAPLPAFLRHNIKTGLGSDSVASNNSCDMLEEARFAVLISRIEEDDGAGYRIVSADDVLHMATRGGARALGLDHEVGALAAGLQADLAIVGLDRPHQQPVHDPSAALVFASSGRDVRMTLVAGKEIYRDGNMTTVDENKVCNRVNEIAAKLKSEA